MPNYTYAGPSAEGFDVNTEKYPDADMRWPIDFATTMPIPFGPFALPMTRIEEWLWRIKRVQVEWEIVDDFTTSNATFIAARKMDSSGTVGVNDEFDLGHPGIPATFGTTSSSGPHWYFSNFLQEDIPDIDDTTGWTISVGVFSKQQILESTGGGGDVYLNLPHMAYNHSTGLYTPSIVIDGTMLMEAGSEYSQHVQSHQIGSEWANDPACVGTCSFFPFHGGGDIPIYCYSGSVPASSISMTVTPHEWFPWGGLWNTSTGAYIPPPP